MIEAYIAIGSNINSEENIREAINLIKSDFPILSKSNYYETKPYGHNKQNNFINLAVKIKTNLKSNGLLKNLKLIEKKLFRKKTVKNGPRTIDLDILLYGTKIINDNDLIIPHKGLLLRDFMLIPLLDINPNIIHPIAKKKIKYLKKCIKYHQIIKIIK